MLFIQAEDRSSSFF